MLEPDKWESALSRARGTIYRNTERISSNALLNLLEVGLILSFGSGWQNGAFSPKGHCCGSAATATSKHSTRCFRTATRN